jgi:hypothetical protein
MSESANLSLPFLAASQAQKHVTHNEALLRLDAVIQLSAVTRSLSAPPSPAEEGARYLVASPASDEWACHENDIAAFQDGSWNFLSPRPGWRLWLQDEAKLLIHTGDAWSEYKVEIASASQLGISASADDTNRLAVSSPASLFNHAGAGHQLKLNKSAAAETAAVLFQTDYSGRAEAGLSGDDHFRLKVSPDGVSWLEAIAIDNASGLVSFPSGAAPAGAQSLGEAIAASPASDSENFNPPGWNGAYPDQATVLRLTPLKSLRLTGLSGGEAARLAVIANGSSSTGADSRLILIEHDAVDSDSANRFSFARRQARLLLPGETSVFIYDAVAATWTALLDPPVAASFDVYSDAHGFYDFTPQVSGTAASARLGSYLATDAAQAPRGICQLDTGSTESGRAHWGSQENSIFPAKCFALYLVRLAVETLSTSAERFQVRAGWHDGHTSADVSNGVYWEYDDSASPVWCLCAARDGVRTKLVSPLEVTSNYVYLGIFLNGDWSRADFFSSTDGRVWSFHDSVSTNSPSGLQPLGFSAGINKTAGTTPRNLSIDLQAVRYDSPRGS